MARELSVRLNGIEVGTLSLVNGKMEFLYSDSCEYPIPDTDIPTTHIIKTALPKYSQSIQNEYIHY